MIDFAVVISLMMGMVMYELVMIAAHKMKRRWGENPKRWRKR